MDKDTIENLMPLQTIDLIKWLDKVYAMQNPGPKDDMQTIMFRAGQRSVIEFLKHRSETENNLLTKVIK